MQETRDTNRNKHVALWVAVGGTMAAIVALWFVALPLQMRDVRLDGLRDAVRWGAARDAAPAEEPSFDDALAAQRRALEAMEQPAPVEQESGKIDRLQAKIEASPSAIRASDDKSGDTSADAQTPAP